MRFCNLLICTAVVAATAFVASVAEAGEVRVTLEGVEARGGSLLGRLQTETQFMGEQAAGAVSVSAPSATGDVTLVFPNIAPGFYAFQVMHDQNGDYQMQMQPNGMPAEGWAMSNGGRLMGPPTFDVLRFEVTSAPVTTITERMSYPWVPPAQ